MTALRRFVPMFDRILIKKLEPITQTKSGVLLPEKATKPAMGTVVAIGPGHRNKEGKYIPVAVAVGDTVALPEYGGSKIEIDDVEHHIYKEQDLLGKMTN